MKVYRESFHVQSPGHRVAFHTVTQEVKDILARSEIKNGLLVVYSHHTTCSVITQEDAFDMSYTGLDYLQQDLVNVFEKLIPTCRHEGFYMHPGPKATVFANEHDESNAEALNTDAHLRSSIVGRNVTIVVADGEMDLGSFGHIQFIDFDQTRPRTRTVQVQIIGE